MMVCKIYKKINTCPHSTKDFETLKKDFPYFKAETLEELQMQVCHLCKSEWSIPRFRD